jgi:hypothetical protein
MRHSAPKTSPWGRGSLLRTLVQYRTRGRRGRRAQDLGPGCRRPHPDGTEVPDTSHPLHRFRSPHLQGSCSVLGPDPSSAGRETERFPCHHYDFPSYPGLFELLISMPYRRYHLALTMPALVRRGTWALDLTSSLPRSRLAPPFEQVASGPVA